MDRVVSVFFTAGRPVDSHLVSGGNRWCSDARPWRVVYRCTPLREEAIRYVSLDSSRHIMALNSDGYRVVLTDETNLQQIGRISCLRDCMKPQSVIGVSLQKSLPLAFCLAPIGCHTQSAHTRPSIELTHIPPAAQGGRERVDTISGRVRNARPKQQIVIYAHRGPWWVQPWPPYLGS